MEPALTAALLWLVFGATHVGLATRRVRAALVARLGEHGFTALFSVVASAAFAVAIAYFAAHRNEGATGLALAHVAALRWTLMAVSVTGIVLVSAGSATYVGSPYDLFAGRVRAPRGIERITRHPFFAGLALFALAHALLATRLIGTVGFAGLALVTIVGARHQDAKVLARAGKPYADYLAATSAVPFAALLAGRQRWVWSELPLGAFATGLAVAVVLRAVHGSIFAHGGAWVIVSVIGGAAIFTWQSARRARRLGAALAVNT
ncbi:MAG: hypothetical protein E6J71_15185 [Deltaproteobacteria bacterium]|nr:MAG: hypothetical protein E6J77_22965 [Deltaproteobacteria bacterium]TMB17020.1 MAG: hypothetical protein E6J71_15185 [Deltaproteobacteria bacterium]